MLNLRKDLIFKKLGYEANNSFTLYNCYGIFKQERARLKQYDCLIKFEIIINFNISDK